MNPERAAKAAAEPGGDAIANQPTFVWLDRRSDTAGTAAKRGLRAHLDGALAQGANVVQLIINALPGRDCEGFPALFRQLVQNAYPPLNRPRRPASAGPRAGRRSQPGGQANSRTALRSVYWATWRPSTAPASSAYREWIPEKTLASMFSRVRACQAV